MASLPDDTPTSLPLRQSSKASEMPEEKRAYSPELCQSCKELQVCNPGSGRPGSLHLGPTVAELRLNRENCGVCAITDDLLARIAVHPKFMNKHVVFIEEETRVRYHGSVGDEDFEAQHGPNEYPYRGRKKSQRGIGVHFKADNEQKDSYHYTGRLGLVLDVYAPYGKFVCTYVQLSSIVIPVKMQMRMCGRSSLSARLGTVT